MTVYDLIDYILDDSKVEIYLLDEEKVVFRGDVYDIPENLKMLEVSTIQPSYGNILVINI